MNGPQFQLEVKRTHWLKRYEQFIIAILHKSMFQECLWYHWLFGQGWRGSSHLVFACQSFAAIIWDKAPIPRFGSFSKTHWKENQILLTMNMPFKASFFLQHNEIMACKLKVAWLSGRFITYTLTWKSQGVFKRYLLSFIILVELDLQWFPSIPCAFTSEH